jgi:alpha-mannosidase
MFSSVFRLWIKTKNNKELYGHENSKGHEYFPPENVCDRRERSDDEGIGHPMHSASEALAAGSNRQGEYFAEVDPYYRALRKIEEQAVAQQDDDHGGGGPAHVADGREGDEAGAHTRATIRVVRRFRDSQFTQDISLMPGVPRVDVAMTLDWYERATFLKAGFPVNAESGNVSAEIPYGVIERNQSGEEAVMGKWVDISGPGYGVAIINNGRNGYDAKGNAIHLSLIRGPWGPDPRADEGDHSFGYSIYPHRGGWREGKVQFQALAFNSPLLAMQEPQHDSPQEQWAGKKGGLPDAFSFIKTDSDHVVLYALKQMEGFYDTDAIARFVEIEGREGDVTIQLPRRVRASETTLLEDVGVGSVGEGTTIRFHMKPWEIKTLRLSRAQ